MLKILNSDTYFKWFLFSLVIIGGSSFAVIFLLVWAGPLRELWPNPLYFPGRDFTPLYDTAVVFLTGQTPFFRYFPLTILFYAPFAYLSFNPAIIAMITFNLILSFILANTVVKILKYYKVSLLSGATWIFFLVYIFFCPATAEIISGNTCTITACAIVLFYYLLFIKKRSILAALCLSVATLFKIFPAFLVLIALLNKKYKFVLAFILVMLALVITSVLLFGIPVHITWAEFIVSTIQSGIALTSAVNSTFTSVLYKLLQLSGINTINPIVTIYWVAARVFIVGVLLWWLLKKRAVLNYDKWVILTFSLLSVLMISLPNHTSPYYATCLVLPYILCVFCLNLNLSNKILLTISIGLFAFNTHIFNLLSMTGEVPSKLVYLFPPTTIGSILFIVFILIQIAYIVKEDKQIDTSHEMC